MLKSAKTNIWIGGTLLLVGSVVTGVTFATAQPGGNFIVAYGAIIGGIVQLVSGLTQNECAKQPVLGACWRDEGKR